MGAWPCSSGGSAAIATDHSAPRPLLFMAHPGHELLLLEWMTRRRPVVCVLTDGSGGAGRPRIEETRGLVEGAGATVGAVFGVAPDTEFYAALLRRDVAFFESILAALTAELRRHRVAELVSDAIEYFNPVHDLCSAMACIAARRLASEGRPLVRLCFPIEHGPSARPAGSTVISLPEDRIRAKQEAISSYFSLAQEAARYLAEHGAALGEEILIPVEGPSPLPPPEETPYYETYGRLRLQQARYAELLTYADHVAPMVSALLQRQPEAMASA